MRGTTNYQTQELLKVLEPRTVNSNFWRRVVKDLSKPTRQRREVNLYKIDRYAREGETILVPGKVLSVGEITKKVEVATLKFSVEATKKIADAKGKTLTIMELVQKNPDGKKVRILG